MKDSEIHFDRYTWDCVHDMCTKLATQLRHAHKTLIYPWDRGGYVIAGILTHYGCTMAFDAVCSGVIIDDIADTGQTLATLHTQDSAVLLVREGCAPMPTFYQEIITHHNYVLFPWQDEIVEREEIIAGGFSTVRGKDKV